MLTAQNDYDLKILDQISQAINNPRQWGFATNGDWGGVAANLAFDKYFDLWFFCYHRQKRDIELISKENVTGIGCAYLTVFSSLPLLPTDNAVLTLFNQYQQHPQNATLVQQMRQYFNDQFDQYRTNLIQELLPQLMMARTDVCYGVSAIRNLIHCNIPLQLCSTADVVIPLMRLFLNEYQQQNSSTVLDLEELQPFTLKLTVDDSLLQIQQLLNQWIAVVLQSKNFLQYDYLSALVQFLSTVLPPAVFNRLDTTGVQFQPITSPKDNELGLIDPRAC